MLDNNLAELTLERKTGYLPCLLRAFTPYGISYKLSSPYFSTETILMKLHKHKQDT